MRRVLLLPTLFLCGCLPEASTDQIGYFKSDDPANRVFLLQAKDGSSIDTLRKDAEQKINTPGQFTMVFIVPADVTTPPDVVTGASDYLQAVDAVYDTEIPFRWRSVMNPNETFVFVDCAVDQEASACPK